jgi:hypothetical protein
MLSSTLYLHILNSLFARDINAKTTYAKLMFSNFVIVVPYKLIHTFTWSPPQLYKSVKSAVLHWCSTLSEDNNSKEPTYLTTYTGYTWLYSVPEGSWENVFLAAATFPNTPMFIPQWFTDMSELFRSKNMQYFKHFLRIQRLILQQF